MTAGDPYRLQLFISLIHSQNKTDGVVSYADRDAGHFVIIGTYLSSRHIFKWPLKVVIATAVPYILK